MGQYTVYTEDIISFDAWIIISTKITVVDSPVVVMDHSDGRIGRCQFLPVGIGSVFRYFLFCLTLH